MERRNLYQDDLTQERQPSPAQRDDVATTEALDPDTNDSGQAGVPDAPDEPDDDDDEEDEEDDDEVEDRTR